MGKTKFVIFLISLVLFLIALNGYAMAQLTEEQLEAFRSAKTVLIEIEQSYEDAKDVSLPFEVISQRLLGYTGIATVRTESKKYDMTIKIETWGKARGAYYTGTNPGTYYTGALITGVIYLKISNAPSYKKSFKGIIDTKWSINKLYSTPSAAPFYEALFESGSFLPTIIEIMRELYGLNTLIAILKDENKDIRMNAAIALKKLNWMPKTQEEKVCYLFAAQEWDELEEIGTPSVKILIDALKDKNSNICIQATIKLWRIKDPRAVEPLIAILKNKDENRSLVRHYAAQAFWSLKDPRAVEPLIAILEDRFEGSGFQSTATKALRLITEENFSRDEVDKWRKWWKENKERLLKKK